MTNPNHTDTSRSGDLVAAMKDQIESWEFEDPRETWWKWQHQYAQAADRIEALEAENERLRKLTCATWFYMPDEGDRCWFSPHEVIDEMYDPEPGNHVFEVECATSLPSIWCAVRVTDDPDADERFTFTEHETEAEARAALGEKQ